MQYIDLHTHTVYSDGICSVAEVLKTAETAGVQLLSLSDHNTVAAYEELSEHRHLFSGKILPASELSTFYQGESIEILAYGIDVAQMATYIGEHYMTLDQKRMAEAKLTGRVLTQRGVVLDQAFLETMYTAPQSVAGFDRYGCRPLYLQEMRKYPENARFFESEEEFYSLSRHRWYRNYLANPQNQLYVDQTGIFPALGELVGVIHRLGGLAFLAHTFVYSPNIATALDDLTQNYGLDGLECYYGTFTKEQQEYLCHYCDRKGLYKSGGSDFHGLDFRPDNFLGRATGERIGFSVMEAWYDRVKDSII